MGDSERSIGSEVGRGRSGVVYFGRDARGRDVVEKVFGGDTASRVVLYALTGAPNPYIWNEHAIACAVARRRILSHLVRHWFGDRLRLPRTDGCGWNESHRAFAIHCEFIRGRHVPLLLGRPLRQAGAERAGAEGPSQAWHDDALKDLRWHVMKPLQKLLRQSGFDGLVWQAGMGNPVATNNFMLVQHDGVSGEAGGVEGSALLADARADAREGTAGGGVTGADAAHRWVWIDLESGVPALFPLNPWPLLWFYLPASWRHRRPMFDDVDLPRLEKYLQALFTTPGHGFDEQAMMEMNDALAELGQRQRAWKATGRIDRSIIAARMMGRITEAQAAWYARHRLLWMVRLMALGARSAVVRGAVGAVRLVRRLAVFIGNLLGPKLFRFLMSQRYRTRLSRRMVSLRIGAYERRGQLLASEAKQLRRELRSDESTEYVTDFGIHLSFKPFVKSFQWTLVPVGVAYGWFTPVMAVVLLAGIGCVVRSAYTLGRCVYAGARGQRLPWVALLVGMLPTVGTLAYPAQLAWAAEREQRLARFIIDDSFATVGRRLPVWGGADSFVEHVFNRLPRWFSRLLPRRIFSVSGALRPSSQSSLPPA